MNYRILVPIFVSLLAFVIPACSPASNSSPDSAGYGSLQANQKTEIHTSDKQAWEKDWDGTLQAARKEGKVVIYALSIGPTLKQLAPSFKKKFGFDLEVVPMDKGPELMAKTSMERKAGLYLPDVIFSGTNTFYGMIKPSGLADPIEPMLVLPEILDPNLWYGGKLPWGDKEHLLFMSYAYPNITLGINTNLANPEEIVSYNDLLNPKWKGKILMNDPTTAGTGLKSFSVLAYHILNLDFFRQLARQEPMIIRDQRLQVDWLAKGKYSVLVFPRTAPMTEFIKAGAPVAFHLPVEGSYLTAGSVMNYSNKAPHPGASRIFINWFLSKEGQSLTQAVDGVQTARVDVPTEGIDPLKVRQPGRKYFLGADTEEWVSRDQEYTKAAMEIMGQFIR